MKTTAVTAREAPAPVTLWRCGGRQCGAGECEHDEHALHRHASEPGPQYAPPIVHDVLRSPGDPLPAAVRRTMEDRLGQDFADVRIHTDAASARSARTVGAVAYTVGRHVVFGAGDFDPSSPTGRRLLAHELTHAAASPPGSPVPSGRLRVSSPDDPAERHASREADSATSSRTPPARSPVAAAGSEIVHRAMAATDPATRLSQGLPLPYREATEYATCMQIMDDRTYCDREVLGIQPAPTAAAPPDTCVPSRALTWPDFSGTPPAASQFAALTRFSFSSTTSGGRDWIVATFNGSSSWVKPEAANAGDRAQNGCAPQVQACEQHFDANAGNVGVTWHLGPINGCPASHQPDTSLTATTRTECDTVLGVECDRVAGLNSQRLLHHEQQHFSLACVMADKGNAALAASPAPSTQSIVTAVTTKANQQTTAYDNASNHGCNAAGQTTWDTQIAQGLPGVTVP